MKLYDKSYEGMRQKSLSVEIKFKQCVYSNKLIYILVAGLEALCAVRRKVRCYLQVRKKVNVVLGIHDPGSNRVRIKVTIRTGWSPKVVC